jgi:hypothetical protein
LARAAKIKINEIKLLGYETNKRHAQHRSVPSYLAMML